MTVRSRRVLPVLRVEPSSVQLFRFSAVTWNAHRVHYDTAHAESEGHDGLLVHSHLRAAFALRCLTEGLGDGTTVLRCGYRVLEPALVGQPLEYHAEWLEGDGRTNTWRLTEIRADGVTGFEGTAIVTAEEED